MCNSQVNWRIMLKAISKEGMGFYVQEVERELKDKINHGMISEWEEVVARFEDVFNMLIDMAMCIGGHVRRERCGIVLLPLKTNSVSSTWERCQVAGREIIQI